MTHKDGKPFTHEEVKEFFSKLLDNGYERYPMGECDNFDKQDGCLGHEISEKEGDA